MEKKEEENTGKCNVSAMSKGIWFCSESIDLKAYGSAL